MSTSPTSPGKECFWKPCTNLFLRSVHLLLSDKLLLFCCEPCSKQGQEPLVSLVLSLPKELCACRKDSHVSSAPGIHSAQHKLKQHQDRGKEFVKVNNLFLWHQAHVTATCLIRKHKLGFSLNTIYFLGQVSLSCLHLCASRGTSKSTGQHRIFGRYCQPQLWRRVNDWTARRKVIRFTRSANYFVAWVQHKNSRETQQQRAICSLWIKPKMQRSLLHSSEGRVARFHRKHYSNHFGH